MYDSTLVGPIDIKSLQNRLLKVCYEPATSAGLPRVSFFFSFLFWLLWPLTVLMKQTRQAVRAIKQSIFLDVYGRALGFQNGVCHFCRLKIDQVMPETRAMHNPWLAHGGDK